MEGNTYNVIAFQTDTYNEAAVLDVSPSPDAVIRVNMLWYSTDEYVEMTPQDLSSVNVPLEERNGLVVVEWGGEEVSPLISENRY